MDIARTVRRMNLLNAVLAALIIVVVLLGQVGFWPFPAPTASLVAGAFGVAACVNSLIMLRVLKP